MGDGFDLRSIAWVRTDDDLEHLHEAIETAVEVVWDLETTGLDEFAVQGDERRNGGVGARVVLISLTLPQSYAADESPTTWIVPLSHPDSPFLGRWRAVLALIAEDISEKPHVGHNIKFDCRWVFATTGVDLSHSISWDSQISSHLLDENQPTRLKHRAPTTFDIPPWDDFDLDYPGAAEQVPLWQLGEYAARDTYWCWRLADLHRSLMFIDAEDEPHSPEEVREARLGKVALRVALPGVAALTAIEQRGIGLDVERTRRESDEHRAAAADLHDRLGSRYPGTCDPAKASFAPTSHWFRDWTQAAVDAGDLQVAELTPTGKPKWSKSVLRRQARDGSETALDLLALRSHTKKIEYLHAWLSLEHEGVIHSTYRSGSVSTGRLSSNAPNMQQVTQTLRPCFVPRPDYLLADLDYSQIELRVAAFVSRCLPMIEAFRAGRDLHTMLAARITGKPEDAVTHDERQHGKSANFGLLYGMGPYGFRAYAEDVYGVRMSEAEARAIHKAFFETWEGMEAWHRRTERELARTGESVSPLGRTRRFGRDDDTGNWRAAVNAPVQGFASDLMQIAMASIEGTMAHHGIPPVAGARIVATVHDSIVVEVPESDWRATTEQCVRRMIEVPEVLAGMDCAFDVPLEVEAKIGPRWGVADVVL